MMEKSKTNEQDIFGYENKKLNRNLNNCINSLKNT